MLTILAIVYAVIFIYVFAKLLEAEKFRKKKENSFYSNKKVQFRASFSNKFSTLCKVFLSVSIISLIVLFVDERLMIALFDLSLKAYLTVRTIAYILFLISACNLFTYGYLASRVFSQFLFVTDDEVKGACFDYNKGIFMEPVTFSVKLSEITDMVVMQKESFGAYSMNTLHIHTKGHSHRLIMPLDSHEIRHFIENKQSSVKEQNKSVQ